MDENIIQLTAEELAIQAIFNSDHSQLTWDNKIFTQANFCTLSQELALEYCQKKSNKNIFILLIKSKYFFSVWIQIAVTNNSNQDKTPTKESSSEVSSSHKAEKNKPQTKSTKPEQPIKKMKRKYRGKIYEVEIPDSSATAQTQKPKPRRKYRGRYID